MEDVASATAAAVEGLPTGIFNVTDDDPAPLAWLYRGIGLAFVSHMSDEPVLPRLSFGPFSSHHDVLARRLAEVVGQRRILDSSSDNHATDAQGENCQRSFTPVGTLQVGLK